MKRPLRNKAAAALFYVAVGLGGGIFLGTWMFEAWAMGPLGTFVVSVLWNFLVGTAAILGYRELEAIDAHRRAKADEARLEETWQRLLREDGDQ
jgi:hypothetical protein